MGIGRIAPDVLKLTNTAYVEPPSHAVLAPPQERHGCTAPPFPRRPSSGRGAPQVPLAAQIRFRTFAFFVANSSSVSTPAL